MRKALKAVTLMGLAAALMAPAATVKAADMDMGSTKVTIGGQLRERLEWWGQEVGTGKGAELVGSYRARLKIKAELSDGVTAVFTPQAVGYWGENGQGLALGEKITESDGVSGTTNTVNMHEAYMLLSNPFGIDNVIVKLGRQEVNLGNQRLVGAVGWSQAGRSLDGILVGYVAGDYGLAGFFYGKLKDDAKLGAWATPTVEDEPDIDLYVATWQGKFKPFGVGGTYELTDIYVNPTTPALGVDADVNTIYGRVTPAFDTDFAKIKVNLEGAYQSGSAGKPDFGGYMFSVGAGADFDQVAWTPSVFLGYDYYSGDDNPNDDDLDAFWSVLPTAHKWLGHADTVWVNTPFYQFNGAGLLHVASPTMKITVKGQDKYFNVAGVEDLYLKLHAKPLDKLALGLDIHYFQAAEDVVEYQKSGNTWQKVKNYGDDIGWEADLEAKYKYSKNLCLSVGYDYFDPDDAMEAVAGGDEAEHHVWAQADLKF
ncbi:Alginate export [Balnearium lithotrophicum]|uniref:Alginate export n=1 Tax=Balnearium lithotrophicum TaxID=223788 RepID=A0A521C2J8_9BACT|nr:alginate export family protein [Balnearium lithotrophicum]SMO53707.1 Alginate export [Balnearium lithotrophicum]